MGRSVKTTSGKVGAELGVESLQPPRATDHTRPTMPAIGTPRGASGRDPDGVTGGNHKPVSIPNAVAPDAAKGVADTISETFQNPDAGVVP